MATIVVDTNQEYLWNVSDEVLSGVLDFVLDKLDRTTAFYDLLYISRNAGRVAFYELGAEQKNLLKKHVKTFYASKQQQLGTMSKDVHDYAVVSEFAKKSKQLLDLITFAESLEVVA
jgi:hypothetical protein